MIDDMYHEDLAKIYDTIYLKGRKKNFAAEADTVVRLVRERNPRAETLLDVACGTGEHLVYLRKEFRHVEGLELSKAMRQAAIDKLLDVPVHAGDMRDFDLGTRFDAITCLSSSIGYLPTVEALPETISTLARHLNPGGVLMIEPWYTPQQWADNAITYSTSEIDGSSIIRMGHASSEGRKSVMRGHYLVGEQSGIRHFQDEHVFTLFTDDEFRQAFEGAGCSAERVEGHLPGRDPWVGVRRQ